MKRYSSYKDSGVEWIGEIPSHWENSKLKFVSEIVTGNTPPTKDENNYDGGKFLWVKPNEINGFIPTNDTNQKLTEEGKSLSRVLPPYTVFVNGIGRIGEFGYSEKSVSTNQQINSIIYNSKVDKRFGLYHTFMMKEGFVSNSEKVVVPILNKTKQENIEFIVPPLSEQQQIVSYLDEQTSSIDTLIQSKQKKITLLKEKRTSLINQIVTKGLNPNVEMKDSGVEWIGEIPRGWELPSLNKISKITRLAGAEYTSYWREEEEGEIQVLRGQNIGSGKIIHNNIKRISNELSMRLIRSRLFKGDIVFPCVGTIGNSVVIEENDKYHINQNISKITPVDEVDSYFLNYYLLSHTTKFQIIYHNTSEVQPSVLVSNLRRFYICLPPLSEQIEIVEYLDRETELIDKTVSIEERKIELLKEYKQSLISEVITGKRKVVSDE